MFQADLPSTYEVGPTSKFSLDVVSVTLESKMEQSAKLALPVVDVSPLLSAIVYTLQNWLEKKYLIKTHEINMIIGQNQVLEDLLLY